MTRVWFAKVTKRDAKALCRWWNSHGRPSLRGAKFYGIKSGRFWDVIRTD